MLRKAMETGLSFRATACVRDTPFQQWLATAYQLRPSTVARQHTWRMSCAGAYISNMRDVFSVDEDWTKAVATLSHFFMSQISLKLGKGKLKLSINSILY
jgi:hypothetical protein